MTRRRTAVAIGVGAILGMMLVPFILVLVWELGDGAVSM